MSTASNLTRSVCVMANTLCALPSCCAPHDMPRRPRPSHRQTLPTQRDVAPRARPPPGAPSMVPDGSVGNVIDLCSSEDDDALSVPAAQAEPAAVPLSQRRLPRDISRPHLFMHQQPAANGTGRRKQAEGKQAAVRAAGSKSAASSSSAAVSRSAASSSSVASSSSGHRGEVDDVHKIVSTRIEVWWDGDEEWCAARQGSALPRCRPDCMASAPQVRWPSGRVRRGWRVPSCGVRRRRQQDGEPA